MNGSKMSKRVLLTGASGFVGHHCLDYFVRNTDWFLVCLDSFRHKGTYSRLSEIDIPKDRVQILNHDLSVPIDQVLENKIIGNSNVDFIINMASDSAVERSVQNPSGCWRNNCELIFNILEFARKVNPDIFFQISTDEVYGDCWGGVPHKEWDVICPSNPYAASKAAQEALAFSYFRTYDIPVVITNCMNVVGSRQDKEKFLPKIISKIATDQILDIYADFDKSGNPLVGSRFYLHAQNHADALFWLSKRQVSRYSKGFDRPDRYNIVGDLELNNLDLALIVADIMGKKLKYRLVPSQSARPGYDKRYALDGSKIKNAGWNPPVTFLEGLSEIIEWTLKNPWWI